MTRCLSKYLLLASVGFMCWLGIAKAEEPPKATGRAPVKIGMLKTMFRGQPAGRFAAAQAMFNTLVKSHTGLDGELVLVDSPDQMRQDLMNGTVQLGAFHGFEFAWMKLKEPNLEPIMLAAVNPNVLKAVVVVSKSSPSTNVEQLQGKSVSVPTCTREHCRLFLGRRCPRGRNMQEYFAEMPAPTTAEDAMDDVVEGKTYAAVVDEASLQTYERRKPGRFAQLKKLEESGVFPASVIAKSSNGLDVETVKKFQKGMSTAHTTLMGSQMMSQMKIVQFEPIPGNYEQVMAEIIKAYPPLWTLAQN